MKLKNNFQRNLIMNLFFLLNSSIMSIIFIIYRLYFKLPLWAILVFGILVWLFYYLDPLNITKIIFKKYCNKKCQNCSMWHCDLHYKDGKYLK